MIKSFNLTCEPCGESMRMLSQQKDPLNMEVEMIFECPKCNATVIFCATVPREDDGK